MAAEKDLIVAIELGSFSIRGIAGRKNFDGSIQILDIVERPSMNCIRKGIIYNIDKTIKNINSIISQLNQDLDVFTYDTQLRISTTGYKRRYFQ